MEHHVVEREIAGRTLRLETGKLAKQAAGSVLVTYGETVVLAASVAGPPRPGADFFPLQADYREKAYAAGKFPGGFFKREARPTQKEILTMRMIDRPIRPLFPKNFYDEVLLQTMVLSTDQENDGDILAMIGASASLAVSHLPFAGPIGAVRIGYIDDEYVVNPTLEQMEYTHLEAVIAGHPDGLNMIEVGALEMPEDVVAGAVAQGAKVVAQVCEMIEELAKKAAPEKTYEAPEPDDALLKELTKKYRDRIKKARSIAGKLDRRAAINEVMDDIRQTYCPEDVAEPEHDWSKIRGLVDTIQKDVISEMVVREDKRSDGRSALQLRDLLSEVGVIPRVHGSSLFQRGETQSLCITTLGTGRDEQIVDGLAEEYSRKFMLHYNFPPLCVGEVRRLGATSRREIGHGNLAEKALEGVMPSPEDFPYTVRLVSEILESNGSSSMASVCAGCLALMDAGVPIHQPVAGISVGMFEHGGDYKMVVDILGEEDHYGLMDFKVAGSQRGITAIQLDLKAHAISQEMVEETLQIARDARIEILRNMLSALSAPRPKTSPHAPRLLRTSIPEDKIGRLIGPGGKYIKMIEAETGAKVEIGDDGQIVIAARDMESAEKALEMVEAVTAEVKVGKIYTGKVSSIKDFGAFVELSPGQDGLCHISELSSEFVRSAADVVNVGDTIRVKVISIDPQGRIKLSRKAVDAEEEAPVA